MMFSIEVVLLSIAITFVAAWSLGHNVGVRRGLERMMLFMTVEELKNVRKRMTEAEGDI